MAGEVTFLSRNLFGGPVLWRLLLIYAISLAALVAYGQIQGFRSSPSFLDYDEFEYWSAAGQLLAGGGFDPGRRTPGFPILIAVLRWVLDDFRFVSIALLFVGATAAPLLYLLVRRMKGSVPTAMLAGALLAVWPPTVSFQSSFYSETLALPLLLIFLLTLPSWAKREKFPISSLILSGILLALCSLVRPMYQLFLPFVFFIFVAESLSPGRAIRGFFVFLASYSMSLLPWSIYASNQTGHFTLLSRNGGETLAGGFNQRILHNPPKPIAVERRETWVGPGKWIRSSETGYLTEDEAKNLSYSEQDSLLTQRTLQWMNQNRKDAAQLLIAKWGYMWGYYPWSRLSIVQIILGCIPLIILQIVLIVWFASHPRRIIDWARLIALPVFVTGVAAISWGSWRFRQPADAAMIAMLALLLPHLITSLRNVSRQSRAVTLP